MLPSCGRRLLVAHPSGLALCLAVAASLASAFYLPGVSPKEYEDGTAVNLKVNKLTSSKTQLPFRYYVLPYCQPKAITPSAENLGELLMGDAIENSPYDIKMMINTTCTKLCETTLDKSMKKKFRSMISDNYMVNWIVDNLPATTRYVQTGAGANSEGMFQSGFPVGGSDGKGKYFVYNHVRLYLKYHQNKEKYQYTRIVGFEVAPDSRVDCSISSEANHAGLRKGKITYTYDVQWIESSVRWASRWDSYLHMAGGDIHWFSIMNSFVIMVLLSGMVAMILLRTLHRDITKYNELATKEDAAEETGWKLVHGDVFRRPEWAKLLCISVGCGVQLLGMAVLTVIFAALGFLSPANRGGLLQSMMLLFTFMGMLSGHTASRLYRVFNGEDWKLMTIGTALLYPGFMFAIFFVLNLLIWGEESSGAVPFPTMFAILVMWFGISVPLVYLGAYFGFRKDTIALPVRTNQLVRQIPLQSWIFGTLPTSFIGGLLPFGAIFTELYFIMSSLWNHQFYYLFGFLILTLVILVVTCAEISITLTYFQLTAEDHRWWWRSFIGCGSCAFYVFFYSVIYFTMRLQITRWVSTFLYFGYMLIASVSLFLLTGSVGLLSSFFFTRAIYGSIKID